MFFYSTIISNQKTYVHRFLLANALTLIDGGLRGVQRHILSVSHAGTIFVSSACCLAWRVADP
jgi:hypothetical protein